MVTDKMFCTGLGMGSLFAALLILGCNGATDQVTSEALTAAPDGNQPNSTSTSVPTTTPSTTTTSSSGPTAIPLNYVVYVGAQLSMSKANILAANSESSLSLGTLGAPQSGAQLTDTGSNYVFQSSVVGYSQFSYSVVDGSGNVAVSTITVDVLDLDKWAGSFYGTDDAGNVYVLNSDGTLDLAQSVTFNSAPIGFNDLAMTSDGTLYGKSYDSATGANAIYSVSGSTGVATEVAANLLPSVSTSMAGLTFLSDGRIVTAVSTSHSDGVAGPVSLMAINPTTQFYTTLVPLSAGYKMYGGDVKLLPDGYLYWTVGNSPGSQCGGNGDQDIVRVDPNSGTVTEIGCLDQSGVYGLGYVFGDILGFSGSGDLIQIDLANAQTSLLEATGKTFAGGTSNPLLWNTMEY